MRTLAILITALFTMTASAATPDWEHLSQVPIGTTIVVHAREMIVCHFEQTLAQTLYCSNSGREFEIPQGDIESVRRTRHRDEDAGERSLVGGAAFVGALMGGRAGGEKGAVLGGVIGLAAGGLAALALHEEKGRLIYRRP